jgi:hypothetical protein
VLEWGGAEVATVGEGVRDGLLFVRVRGWLGKVPGRRTAHPGRVALALVGVVARRRGAQAVAAVVSEVEAGGRRRPCTSKDVYGHARAGLAMLGRCPHPWLDAEAGRVLAAELRLEVAILEVSGCLGGCEAFGLIEEAGVVRGLWGEAVR